jgi:hypothetical protein
MGMFDEIICDYPLPGEPPEFVRDPGHVFQTKSLDSTLDTYTITADGRLVPGMDTFTGEIEFHDDNIAGAAEGFWFTRGGEDAEFVAYLARFRDGVLREIAETSRDRKLALPVASLDRPGPPPPRKSTGGSGDDAPPPPLLGRRMCRRRYAGNDAFRAEWFEVAAESEREVVILKHDGRFEVVDRRRVAETFHGSEDKLRERHRGVTEARERRRAAWAAELAERQATKEARP